VANQLLGSIYDIKMEDFNLILIWNQFYKIVRKQKQRTVCIHSTQQQKLKTDCHTIVIIQL